MDNGRTRGLLIYLPATAWEQPFIGIGARAARPRRSGAPLVPDEFAAAVVEDREANGRQRLTFQLVLNEQCTPVVEWFGARGRTKAATRLADNCRMVGRPVPHRIPSLGRLSPVTPWSAQSRSDRFTDSRYSASSTS
ncbi:hypothetical protein [Mycobacterium sp.]|uniref:hypothetical protein n=1 Tax=Mycobacterium sp. TaxID=1785 RepID=UPI003F9A2FF4